MLSLCVSLVHVQLPWAVSFPGAGAWARILPLSPPTRMVWALFGTDQMQGDAPLWFAPWVAPGAAPCPFG